MWVLSRVSLLDTRDAQDQDAGVKQDHVLGARDPDPIVVHVGGCGGQIGGRMGPRAGRERATTSSMDAEFSPRVGPTSRLHCTRWWWTATATVAAMARAGRGVRAQRVATGARGRWRLARTFARPLRPRMICGEAPLETLATAFLS